MGPLVVAGSASGPFAARLAAELGTKQVPGETKRFPDGEGYVRLLGDVKGRDVVVAQSTAPDANLVELLLWLDAAREAGARTLTAAIPYLGYARQDRIFNPGEALSSRVAARAIAAACDRVVTVDPHKEEILGFFGGKAASVSAVPLLAAELGRWGVDAVLAPDKGARDRAAAAAKLLRVPADHLEKTRVSSTEVRMAPKELDVRGKRVSGLRGRDARPLHRQRPAQPPVRRPRPRPRHRHVADGPLLVRPGERRAGRGCRAQGRRLIQAGTVPLVGCAMTRDPPALGWRL